MNITNLGYVGDYAILYYVCKYATIILGFIVLNIMLLTKKKEKETKAFKIAIITSIVLLLASCIGWANFGLKTDKNISNFIVEVQDNISTDYAINSESAYQDIAKVYDCTAIGKDFVSDDFVVYNKITKQDEKVRLEYKNGVLKIRGIL